jgi:hypothetical protein
MLKSVLLAGLGVRGESFLFNLSYLIFIIEFIFSIEKEKIILQKA